jgi:hypothetical protein
MFTGMVVSTLYGGHDGRMFVMVLVPLAFACLERGLQTGRPGWFVGMGLVVALQVFTPHVQLMYYSSLCLSLYAMLRIVEVWRGGEGGRGGAVRLLGWFSFGFVIAALIGAAQLVPTWRILDIAVRGGTGESGYPFAASWALPPQEVTSLFLTDLIGSLGTYWGSNPFKLHTEYLGSVTVVLALLALTSVRSDLRVRNLGALALLCLLFALGAATPVHRLMYAVIPFVARFRAPSMMLGPGALFVALLAGIGWQRVIDGSRESERMPSWTAVALLVGPLLLFGLVALASPAGLARWTHTALFPAGWERFPGPEALTALRGNGAAVVLGCTVVLGGLWGITRRSWPPATVGLAVLAVLVGDLWRVDMRYLETTTPAEAFPEDESVRLLRGDLLAGERVFPVPGRVGFRPNELMGYRVPSVTGSQNFRLEWFERLSGGLSYRNFGAPAMWPLLDLRFVTTDTAVETPLLSMVGQGGRGIVYEVTADLPHAWFPTAIEATRDTALALARVLAMSDPAALAVVEADAAPMAGSGTASVTNYEPDEVVFEVQAEEAGLLFVSEIWHPSWNAYVDGEQVEVLRTNVAFRGVVIPAGRHELRFEYSAAEFRLGFGLSALGVVAALAVLIVGRFRTAAEPHAET